MDELEIESWPTSAHRVWTIEGEHSLQHDMEVVLEEPLSLHVNGQQVAVLMRLPGMEKELAAGFCVSEGLVKSFDDVLTIHHCGQGLPSPVEGESVSTAPESRNRVEVRVRPEALRPEARMEVVRLIRAGCGAVDVSAVELNLSPVQSELTVGYRTLLDLERTMREAQKLHRQVGGVHAAALYDASGTLVVLSEDIGRHNAVDKAVGWCLLRGISLTDKLLLSSGRLSYEMLTKAIRLGLPLVASVSAPTALAVQLAESYHVTLIGYLRGRRMIIYTHPERVRLPEG